MAHLETDPPVGRMSFIGIRPLFLVPLKRTLRKTGTGLLLNRLFDIRLVGAQDLAHFGGRRALTNALDQLGQLVP